eukprot:3634204-Pyramimonas_sp.AAC.1
MGPRSAVLGGVDACGLWHWSLRWRSLCSREALAWMALPHAACATGTFGGAPYDAPKRSPGWR